MGGWWSSTGRQACREGPSFLDLEKQIVKWIQLENVETGESVSSCMGCGTGGRNRVSCEIDLNILKNMESNWGEGQC